MLSEVQIPARHAAQDPCMGLWMDGLHEHASARMSARLMFVGTWLQMWAICYSVLHCPMHVSQLIFVCHFSIWILRLQVVFHLP